jgi:hypothetical protein
VEGSKTLNHSRSNSISFLESVATWIFHHLSSTELSHDLSKLAPVKLGIQMLREYPVVTRILHSPPFSRSADRLALLSAMAASSQKLGCILAPAPNGRRGEVASSSSSSYERACSPFVREPSGSKALDR